MIITSLVSECTCLSPRLVSSGQSFSHSSDIFVLPSRTGSSQPAPTGSGVGTSSAGLWARDTALTAPIITSVDRTDNAIILGWTDDINTMQSGYVICFFNCSENYSIRLNDPNIRGAGIFAVPVRINLGIPAPATGIVLQPGASYDVSISAASGNSIGPLANQSVLLTNPQIFIGDPSNNMTQTPPASQAFAAWDRNNDGILRDAQGTGGVFPRFQSTVEAVEAGNTFDRAGHVPANVVVGYYFVLNNAAQFVAFHLFVDPTSTQTIPVSVLYGDAEPGVRGTAVWVSPPGSEIRSNLQVTAGNPSPTQPSPNVIQGRVTAPTFSAVRGSTRIIEFTFNLALVEN